MTLHFSGTLLGSARGTRLLPVCGRNLYNCLCSFFLCSFHLSAAQRLWTHSDSELLQTLNLRAVLQNVKEEVFKNTIQPPLLVVFLTFTCFWWRHHFRSTYTSDSLFFRCFKLPFLSFVLPEPYKISKILSMVLYSSSNISISNWQFLIPYKIPIKGEKNTRRGVELCLLFLQRWQIFVIFSLLELRCF